MLTKSFFAVHMNSFTICVPEAAILEAVGRGEKLETWKTEFTYRVEEVEFPDRKCWFIMRKIDRGFVYLATLDQQTGNIRLTAGSKIAADMPVFRIAVRVLKAIYDDRGFAIEAAGWDVKDASASAPKAAEALPAAPVQEVAKPAMAGPLRFIADTFTLAVGYGLKRPMLRVHFKDRRFKFYLSKAGTVCLKTGALTEASEDGCRDPMGDEEYAGCLLRGNFLPAQSRLTPAAPVIVRALLPVEVEFMERLAKDATGFIAECGKDMARCCYCSKPLEDARSKKVGYGPICAARWALPWGDEKAMENAPSFAKEYTEEAGQMLWTIREQFKTGEKTGWLVFADWLQERGLPACKAPAMGVQLPRNDC